MAADINALYEIAQAFLDAATDALAFTDAGPPGRRFVSAGQPALDCCGQLTVWTQFLTEADTFSGAGALAGSHKPKIGAAPILTVNIQATRCATGKLDEEGGRITLPTPAELDADAKAISQDGWALWNHLNWALKHGDLAQVCSGAWRDQAQELTPQGGCIGWQFTFRYPIEGGTFGT